MSFKVGAAAEGNVAMLRVLRMSAEPILYEHKLVIWFKLRSSRNQREDAVHLRLYSPNVLFSEGSQYGRVDVANGIAPKACC